MENCVPTHVHICLLHLGLEFPCVCRPHIISYVYYYSYVIYTCMTHCVTREKDLEICKKMPLTELEEEDCRGCLCTGN